jgi:hypothetical protein
MFLVSLGKRRKNTIIRDDQYVPNLYKFIIPSTLIVRHIYSIVKRASKNDIEMISVAPNDEC